MKRIPFANQLIFFFAKPWVFFLTALFLGLALAIPRVFSEYTSPFDEHTHLSYVQYAYNWVIPAEGYEMLSWAKQAFSCHPHSMYGAMTSVPCGTIGVGANYPTGGTNTSQNWPPIYFFIVAIFMRIPALFIPDPLYSARLITAILWTLGTSWIGLQVFQLTKQKTLGILVAVSLVSLPTFYFYTSNVSPHSLNPLMFALAFWICNKFLNSLKQIESGNNKFITLVSKNIWLYVFLILGPIYAFTVPQSLTIIGVCFLYTFINILLSKKTWKRKEKFFAISLWTGTTFISVFFFTRIASWWSWLINFRKIPFPPGVNPAGANSDPADPAYSSLIVRIVKQWWSYWPNGIVPGWPAGQDVNTIITPWVYILVAFSLAALIFWNRNNWLSHLMLSVFIAAPLFAVAYDIYFSTAVPIRYAMGISIAGVISLGNENMSKPAKYALSAVVASTYLSAFILNNYFIDARTCHLDSISQLILCG